MSCLPSVLRAAAYDGADAASSDEDRRVPAEPFVRSGQAWYACVSVGGRQEESDGTEHDSQTASSDGGAEPADSCAVHETGDGTFIPRTYSELRDEAMRSLPVSSTIGSGRGDHVGLVSENRRSGSLPTWVSRRWAPPTFPRGNDSMADELAFILGFSECATVDRGERGPAAQGRRRGRRDQDAQAVRHPRSRVHGRERPVDRLRGGLALPEVRVHTLRRSSRPAAMFLRKTRPS